MSITRLVLHPGQYTSTQGMSATITARMGQRTFKGKNVAKEAVMKMAKTLGVLCNAAFVHTAFHAVIGQSLAGLECLQELWMGKAPSIEGCPRNPKETCQFYVCYTILTQLPCPV
jgi:hypothetical protein